MPTASSSTDVVGCPAAFTGFELAMGWPCGVAGASRVWRRGIDEGLGALDALRDVVRTALVRAPCGVAFSGGRDSSVVLAVAADLARREGHPLPIPCTRRFPGDALAEETEWQERVVGALGLDDWVRLDVGGDLHVLGPYARRHLERDGTVWPPMAHANVPLADVLRGGSLLTGEGGDEVFGAGRAVAALAIRRGRIAPTRSALVAAARAGAPRPWRARRAVEGFRGFFTWLRPDAARAAARAVARDRASVPLRYGRSLDHGDRLRSRRLGVQTTTALAARADVVLVDPFLDARFLAALSRSGGRFGWLDRSDAMVNLFGSLLPRDVLTRTSKAYFDRVVFTEETRSLAMAWDGDLREPLASWVDADGLRREWAAAHPNPTTFGLLQHVWVDGRCGRP